MTRSRKVQIANDSSRIQTTQDSHDIQASGTYRLDDSSDDDETNMRGVLYDPDSETFKIHQ
jgi:hypothetical protein